jgi:hypothetical protein
MGRIESVRIGGGALPAEWVSETQISTTATWRITLDFRSLG